MVTKNHIPCTCPELDARFIIIVRMLELCESKNGNCYSCTVYTDCAKLFNAVSEACSDGPLEYEDYIEYYRKFQEIIRI
jgi:hypothetical protein